MKHDDASEVRTRDITLYEGHPLAGKSNVLAEQSTQGSEESPGKSSSRRRTDRVSWSNGRRIRAGDLSGEESGRRQTQQESAGFEDRTFERPVSDSANSRPFRKGDTSERGHYYAWRRAAIAQLIDIYEAALKAEVTGGYLRVLGQQIVGELETWEEFREKWERDAEVTYKEFLEITRKRL